MTSTAAGGHSESAPTALDHVGESRRDALRKLAVGGAIVWAAPMIQASMPAAASASTLCTTHKIDWDLLTVGSTFTATTVSGVTMSATSTFSGTTARSTNFTIVGAQQGGINQSALRLEQNPHNGGYQQVKFHFSTPVKNVTFSFFDIDNLNSAWSDRIIIVTTPFTFAVPGGSTVNGAGTTASPFKNTQASNNLPNTSGAGNVQVTCAGPISDFVFRFQCATPENGTNQLIDVSDVSFCS